MNIGLTSGQIALLHIILETAHDDFEVYGGTQRGAFQIDYIGTTDANREWLCTVREADVVGTPLGVFNIYARQLNTGREYTILSGKIVVTPRTASVPADKLSPGEYFVHVPVYADSVDVQGAAIIQGIPGPKGDKGDKGEPGEGGMTAEERALLMGAAQRDADNTFTAGNTFTGAVDMSGASVTPPEGWNVGGVTAKAIQAVVPISWIDRCATFGDQAYSYIDSVAIGWQARANSFSGVSVGRGATSHGIGSISLGFCSNNKRNMSINIGVKFEETTDSGNVTHTCTTEGTGSITIGAGANTLNNGDTESSNSVTIGCKARNLGADSVVLGASARGSKADVAVGADAKALGESNVAIGNASVCDGYYNSVAVGQGAVTKQQASVVVGSKAEATQGNAIAIGFQSKGWGYRSTALGHQCKAAAKNAVAIGATANVSDVGATAIRSTAEDGTYTQLYFSGANTPLANTYENGEAMMGYVVRDSAGNIMTDAEGNAMVGTQKLSVLFPNNRGENAFTPAMLGLDDEWTPKPMFRPSDLDMPQEEPTVPEEYQPLPVYPIVEPEIEPLTE